MQESQEIKELLTEIRNTQREHLDEYKRAAQRSLELQQQAVNRQEQIGRLYKRIVFSGGLLIVFIIVLIIYLLGKLR
jgi:cytochrome c-type biogenesis protein CcmH/NrfG